MSTTNLFVELLVIGVGASIWLVLVVLSMFGTSWVPVEQLFSPPAALPLLAIVYVLGIVSDRMADAVFEWLWNDDLRGSRFSSRGEYYNARRIILTRSERLSDLLEYGRSRLRICRGWALNSLLIAVGLNTFLWRWSGDNPAAWGISMFGSITLLLFALGAWYSWRKLALAEYRKVREQADFFAATGPEAQQD